ncbi:MAG TPA: MbtH family NRPS accessory protein [Rubrivivax sp.]|nr:MbtH family NRPS accessory protein [Rubrivivax sp.]
MQRSQRADFGIIINDEQMCTIWPAHRPPPEGWHFTAARGTKAAMQACVDQQFVATAPALPLELDSRYKSAEWAAAEFDD